jgi:membrane protein implicated in regulation of membrane protease activity
MNTRLILALITSLIDEVIIVAAILWGLPHWGIHIPWWGITLICLAFAAYAYLTFRIGSRILRKKPVSGFTDMIGMSGKALHDLNPRGMVRVNSEIWEARTAGERIPIGTDIIVVAQDGMKLMVRAKEK